MMDGISMKMVFPINTLNDYGDIRLHNYSEYSMYSPKTPIAIEGFRNLQSLI